MRIPRSIYGGGLYVDVYTSVYIACNLQRDVRDGRIFRPSPRVSDADLRGRCRTRPKGSGSTRRGWGCAFET